MVRGRRKCTKTRLKTEGGSGEKDPICKGPKKKDSKLARGVNGHLSHASPQVSGKGCITHYFSSTPTPSYTQEKVEEESTKCDADRQCTSDPVLNTENSVIGRPSHQIKHEENPPSPSSALQQLCISPSPKKPSKARRRLNPSQAGNQLIPVKTACCIKADSHQLTEYFPVRRSERRTKRTVLQERQHRIEAAVIAGCEEGLQVHNFEGKGRGVVATRIFCKGEFVVEYAGELIDMTEAKQRERMYAQDQNTGCYMYYFRHHNAQYCVDATAESGRLGRLVNHSRNGNLLTKTVEIDSQPHLVLIAREDIPPGEEVTYDYGDRSKESIRYHPWLLS